MSKIYLFFISFWMISQLSAQLKFDLQITLEGNVREFIVSVPSKAPPPNGWPLVLMLHGTSGDKNVYYNSYGWSELGQKENFITVFPSSLRWCFVDSAGVKNNTKWVCGDLIENICPKDTPKLIDDVLFLRRMVALIGDTFQLNNQKIFLSGFSNGSCMTFRAAMRAGDIFKSCGSTAGGYHELDSIIPAIRVPYWYMVGTHDDGLIRPPYTMLPYGGDSILAYMNPTIRRTLVSLGLSEKFKLTEDSVSKTYKFTECLPGENCKPYYFTLIKGLEHQFPNGRNHAVDAPALFWDFFCNPPSTTTSNETASGITQKQLLVVPNPSKHLVHINLNSFFSKEVHGAVYNAIGHKVMDLIPENGVVEIFKNDVGAGLFFVRISDVAHYGFAKIIFE
ncbi:MAG: hypothetical protein IPM34_04390 [Saprospiraceae bacterium]|nr:hypothetical protein [Saprospiraceae bacterium]